MLSGGCRGTGIIDCAGLVVPYRWGSSPSRCEPRSLSPGSSPVSPTRKRRLHVLGDPWALAGEDPDAEGEETDDDGHRYCEQWIAADELGARRRVHVDQGVPGLSEDRRERVGEDERPADGVRQVGRHVEDRSQVKE